MKEYEYKMLETLLMKLHSELKCDYAIIPNHIQDGYFIQTYDGKGERVKNESSYDIESTVRKLKGLPVKGFYITI